MLICLSLCLAMPTTVRTSAEPPKGDNDFYVGNRAPLQPSAFRKLRIGAIQPHGWVRKQRELQADGFIGHLEEISGFLDKRSNAWLNPKGEGDHGWEET